MLIPLLLVLPMLVHAHPPIERLDDLINGICDDCLCEPACEPIVESECTDIQCACAFQFQAQDCVLNCVKTQDSVNLYNQYLDSCVKESLAIPTATFQVYGNGDTPYPAATSIITGQDPGYNSTTAGYRQFTDVASGGGNGATAYVTQVSTVGMYADADADVNGDLGGKTTVAAALPSDLYATGRDGSVVTDLSGLGLTTYNPSELGTGGLVSTALSNAGGTSSKPALDATNSFFGSAVSQKCVAPCQNWKNQADLCTDDTCLCTPETYAVAQQCSECIGANGLSGRNLPPTSFTTARAGRTDTTMGYWYSKFSEACQTEMPGIANGAAGLRQGQTGVEVVPSGLGYATSAGYGNPAIKPIMVTDTYGRTMMGDGSEYTNTVTATAAAMYAGETIIVDGSSGAFLRHPIAWWLMILCLSLNWINWIS